jgi:hypothetical protein
MASLAVVASPKWLVAPAMEMGSTTNAQRPEGATDADRLSPPPPPAESACMALGALVSTKTHSDGGENQKNPGERRASGPFAKNKQKSHPSRPN